MVRMVQCAKLGRLLPGLEKPPFNDELGQRIYEHISAEAWRQWQGQLTIMINHYGLNLLDPATRDALNEQMEEFFFGEQPEMPEGWIPGESKGGAPAKGGAPVKGGARK
ncbi:MAG TPA: oxidative damage protection protein [Thermomicrobiales bacterium]|nr:oxidative damage protection protein [Thermomicrobiales bacterium]